MSKDRQGAIRQTVGEREREGVANLVETIIQGQKGPLSPLAPRFFLLIANR